MSHRLVFLLPRPTPQRQSAVCSAGSPSHDGEARTRAGFVVITSSNSRARRSAANCLGSRSGTKPERLQAVLSLATASTRLPTFVCAMLGLQGLLVIPTLAT